LIRTIKTMSCWLLIQFVFFGQDSGNCVFMILLVDFFWSLEFNCNGINLLKLSHW
jgi:hypothetical protein